MRLLFTEGQVGFLTDGMRLSERSQSIIHQYFVDGVMATEIARREGVTVSYVTRLVRKTEKNLERVLEARGYQIEVFIVPRPDGPYSETLD